MTNIILKFLLKILNYIYSLFKLLKIQNKIVYISRQFNEPPLDFFLLEKEIKRQNPEIKTIMLTKRLEKSLLSKIRYIFHIFVQMYHIATAKAVILDSYCITISTLKHKKELQIIQLWHALAAIKKFGYQTIGKVSGSSETIARTMKMHKNYSYVIAPSDETAKHFRKAFKVKKTKIKQIGLPRIDYILEENINMNEKIYEKYPIMRNKINLLYVPTFRKQKRIKIKNLINNVDTSKYNLIIKLHPLDRKNYEKYYEIINCESIIFEKEFGTYDLLKVSDKIITDYSSLAVEASLLNKPLFFYVYDIDKYTQDPGLNFNFKKEEIRRYLAKNVKKLFKLIEEDYNYEILKRFKEKYIEVDTNDCSKQLAEFILELINNESAQMAEEMVLQFSQRKHNV